MNHEQDLEPMKASLWAKAPQTDGWMKIYTNASSDDVRMYIMEAKSFLFKIEAGGETKADLSMSAALDFIDEMEFPPL